jgi:hypothetical protein
MDSIFVPVLSPRMRTFPNQLAFKSQPGPPVSISSRERVRAYVEVAKRSVGVVR